MGALKDFYRRLWDARKKTDFDGAEYVECADCEKRIYEPEVAVHHFAHIKSKGIAPELKFDPDNVAIKCFRCHAREREKNFNHYLPIK